MYVEQLPIYIRFLGRQLALGLLLGRDVCDFLPPEAFLPTTAKIGVRQNTVVLVFLVVYFIIGSNRLVSSQLVSCS